MGGQVRTGVGGGRRRDSRGGTEAPLARPRTPLSLCAGVTARLAAGVLPPEVVRGGWVAVFWLWINLCKTVDIL